MEILMFMRCTIQPNLNYTLIEEDLKRIIAQYKNIITSDKNSLIALSGQSKKSTTRKILSLNHL